VKWIALACLAVACLWCAAWAGASAAEAGADQTGSVAAAPSAHASGQAGAFDVSAGPSPDAAPETPDRQTAVPEPAVIAILAVGGAVVLLRRRR